MRAFTRAAFSLLWPTRAMRAGEVVATAPSGGAADADATQAARGEAAMSASGGTVSSDVVQLNAELLDVTCCPANGARHRVLWQKTFFARLCRAYLVNPVEMSQFVRHVTIRPHA